MSGRAPASAASGTAWTVDTSSFAAAPPARARHGSGVTAARAAPTRPAPSPSSTTAAATRTATAATRTDAPKPRQAPAGPPTRQVARPLRTPGATASALTPAPTTAKGRAVRDELNALGDDFYGGAVSRAPAPVAGSAASGSLSKITGGYTALANEESWWRGPVDSAGRVFSASASNLLCMDVLCSARAPPSAAAGRGRGGTDAGPLCVVGSADHGLTAFDLRSLRARKTLFNKTSGHTDWVTSCKCLRDGRVLSAGMDGKLCLWDSVFSPGTVARCADLLGHTGSISQVEVMENDGDGTARAVSASYDRTLRVWNCGAVRRDAGVLAGHKAPVTMFHWLGTQIASGDRNGTVKIWDLPTAKCVSTLATKRGQVGAVWHAVLDGDDDSSPGNALTLIGDQGGVLTVLDPRQGTTPVCQRALHPGGVLSNIRVVYGDRGAASPMIVTAGADKRVLVLDPRRGFEPVWTLADHTDFIYSLATLGPLVLSGAGNGWLLVHDARTGECCYGLGAGKNAVREIFADPQILVAAGDDGEVSVFDFDG